MRIQRIFLDLHRPAIESALAWCRSPEGPPNCLREIVRNALVVVPTRMVQRQLQAAFRMQVAAGEEIELPPSVITIDQLPEYLYVATGPYLDEFLVPWHWGLAIRKLGPEYRKGWLAASSQGTEADRIQDDMQTGRWIASLHQDVSAEGILFGDVAKQAASSDRMTLEKWTSLAAAEDQYRHDLRELAMEDKQLGRVKSLRQRECQFTRHIVLFSISDLPLLHRRMLEATDASVTSLIYAPMLWQDRFDAMGSLDPTFWQGVDLDIGNERWNVAENPVAAIERTSEIAREWIASGQAKSINVVSTGRELVPLLQYGLKRNHIASKCGVPFDLKKSGTAEFVRCLAEFLRARSFRAFAEFIRHPFWWDWLISAGLSEEWLTDLDHYAGEHLPTHFGVPEIPPAGVGSTVPELNRLLILQLADFVSTTATVPVWASRIHKLLMDLVGLSSGSALLNVQPLSDQIVHVFQRLQLFDVHGTAYHEFLDGTTACHMILEAFEDDRMDSEIETGSVADVTVLDWPDVLLHSSEGTILIGLNESYLPARISSDGELPEEFSGVVRARDANYQQARDRMILATLMKSRKEIQFLVLKADQEDSPLKPSRLLFSLQDEEDVVVKWRKFLAGDRGMKQSQIRSANPVEGGDGSPLSVPRPPEGPIEFHEIRVTAFRTYLECPYRFWLQHIQNLVAVDDTTNELDHFDFGNLAHGVLEHFGRGAHRDEPSADRIFDVLRRLLEQQMNAKFGPHPGIAVQIQGEQLENRLRAFATVQAGFFRDGWRIRYIEQPMQDKSVYLPGVEPKVRLRGRIDRIDVHDVTGAWRVLDYKTSTTAKTPRKAHLQQDAWVDLQLPLYRHLAAALGSPPSVEFGYLNLPQNSAETGLALADWSEVELTAADEEARQVIRKIRAGEFWPPKSLSPTSSDPWDDICLVGVRGG